MPGRPLQMGIQPQPVPQPVLPGVGMPIEEAIEVRARRLHMDANLQPIGRNGMDWGLPRPPREYGGQFVQNEDRIGSGREYLRQSKPYQRADNYVRPARQPYAVEEPRHPHWVQDAFEEPSTWGQTSSQQANHAKSDLKPSHPKPPMAVRRLTPMQMSERRRKGLCYHCDEKWSMGHKCKSPLKLYFMEEVVEEEEDIKAGTEYGEVKLEEEQGEITLCALLGNSSPSTMRVVVVLSGQKTVMLLDTGSTHNFMDSGLATSLKLEVDATNRFGVIFNLLELGGYGIMLGTQLLSTLGMINWDFKKLCMGLYYERKQVWLQGLKESKSLIQGSKDSKEELKKSYEEYGEAKDLILRLQDKGG
ncbi:hypothetical protein SADUNF_Sadunf16G0049100 [Salix dunnii]|uniref:Uncharacterized protein n=1 Tax=Salix dunnii TaxID=1413687 RepID=A0A835J8G9_9ROSI|nr:hypothetical protein SADUNF_Sadunf16G0049100 [Salix dunnii]